MNPPGAAELQDDLRELESLIAVFESVGDPRLEDAARDLVSAMMRLNERGIGRMLEILDDADATGEILSRFADDDTVAGLLLLYDLHPLPVEARIERALVHVRPYLGSHGGNVELLRVEGGIAHLRLEGSCEGCPSSQATLQLAIEQAVLGAAPEVTALEVEGLAPAPTPAARPGFVSLDELAVEAPARPAWHPIEGAESVPESELRSFDAGGLGLVLCRVGDTFYAYRDACARCDSPLAAGTLLDSILSCPSCGAPFDVRRAGCGLDGVAGHLDPLPVLAGPNGEVSVALPSPTPALAR